jgi:hypothetical protein
MNRSGGAIAHAQPAMVPAFSPNCSFPNFASTTAVSDEKITLSRIATTADAGVLIPKKRKMPASKNG